MSYFDDMTMLFIDNYDEPYPVELIGLGMVSIASGVATPTDQPTDSPWLRVSFISGSTFNVSVGSANSRLKRELFNMNVQVMMPRTTYTSGQVYTYSVPFGMERELDSFLVTDGFSAAGENALIYSDQSEPKTKSTPQPSASDTWITTNFGYRYVYQYI